MSADWIYDGELLLCRPNPVHRWYQFSDMRQDELLLFIEHDFADPDHPPVMHSAFADPRCPPGAVGRSSVEVRTFAFFGNEAQPRRRMTSRRTSPITLRAKVQASAA